MNTVPNIPNINQYNQHFNQNAPYIKNQPRRDRGCNDPCCYGLFIFLSLLMLGAGIFFVVNANLDDLKTSNTTTTSGTQKDQANGYDFNNLRPGIPVIIGMVLMSIILSIVFLCLLVHCPKCMMYTMLVCAGLLLLILAVIMFIGNQIAGGVIFIIATLVYIGIVYCFRNSINVGAIILETAGRFLTQRPSVFTVPIIVSFFVILFEFWWFLTLVCITLYGDRLTDAQAKNNAQTLSAIFLPIWLFFQLFYSFFFHYCVVFLIATAAAYWYYNVPGFFLCSGIKRIICNHLGSFTFASFLITLVSMARSSSDQQNRNSGGCNVCYCLVSFCLRVIQDLLQVLNHNAVIVMAVTGENYIDSAKSTISLIFENFPLFYLIDMVGNMLKLVGIIFTSVIPSLIGYLLLKAIAPNPSDQNFLTFGTVIIALISLLISSIFLNVIAEALSCVFIFYCLDKRFVQMGYPTPQNVPPTMRSLFNELQAGVAQSGAYMPVNQPGYPSMAPSRF